MVTAIKAVSSNPYVKVLVGGPAINLMPELAMECGADGTAVDARAAIGLADRLVPLEADRLAGLL
jgi:methanogenic corrinoid protein MtbC1